MHVYIDYLLHIYIYIYIYNYMYLHIDALDIENPRWNLRGESNWHVGRQGASLPCG